MVSDLRESGSKSFLIARPELAECEVAVGIRRRTTKKQAAPERVRRTRRRPGRRSRNPAGTGRAGDSIVRLFQEESGTFLDSPDQTTEQGPHVSRPVQEPAEEWPGSGSGPSAASVPTVTHVPGATSTVGLSQVRESAVFSGIPITERLTAEQRTCGVCVDRPAEWPGGRALAVRDRRTRSVRRGAVADTALPASDQRRRESTGEFLRGPHRVSR